MSKAEKKLAKKLKTRERLEATKPERLEKKQAALEESAFMEWLQYGSAPLGIFRKSEWNYEERRRIYGNAVKKLEQWWALSRARAA